jgi:hypothetical protein
MLQPTHTLALTPENRYLALRDSILGIDTGRAAVIWQPERGNGVYVTNIYAGDVLLTPDDLVDRHSDPKVQPRHSFYFYTGSDRHAFAEADSRIAVLTRPPPIPDNPDASPATAT